jgi:hypothetical protein
MDGEGYLLKIFCHMFLKHVEIFLLSLNFACVTALPKLRVPSIPVAHAVCNYPY